MTGYSSLSGLPNIGGILVVVAGALIPLSPVLGLFLMTLFAIDGNGIPWVLFSILR